ncbi:MAG: hypothetical protein BWY77_01450 [bacterium ADurb.Bin431]|nr:MAG: hypothetical protein BWY77_01450 [bacterium ADurb.Bin431]
MLLVEPVELFKIKNRRRLVDAAKRKLLYQLIEGKNLTVIPLPGIPAEQRNAVEDGRLFIPPADIGGDIGIDLAGGQSLQGLDVPFAHLAAVGIKNQRQMGHLRRLPAEILVQQQVLGHGTQPLLAADDMGDLHEMIIHDIGQVIGRIAIRLEQHLVIHLLAVKDHMAADLILDLELAPLRNEQADGVGRAVRDRLLDLCGREAQTVAHLHPVGEIVLGIGIPRCLGARAHRFDIRRRIKGVVGIPFLEQLLRVTSVGLCALGLKIGATGSAPARALVWA